MTSLRLSSQHPHGRKAISSSKTSVYTLAWGRGLSSYEDQSLNPENSKITHNCGGPPIISAIVGTYTWPPDQSCHQDSPHEEIFEFAWETLQPYASTYYMLNMNTSYRNTCGEVILPVGWFTQRGKKCEFSTFSPSWSSSSSESEVDVTPGLAKFFRLDSTSFFPSFLSGSFLGFSSSFWPSSSFLSCFLGGFSSGPFFLLLSSSITLY